MPHVIETGTDIASLVVFDPLALPDDYDRACERQVDIVRELHNAQRVFQIGTDADGGYLFHVFVDEPISDTLRAFVREPYAHAQFDAPSGRVYFAGLEYAFRSDDARLRRHSHMGGHVSMRPGRYRLTMYCPEYPEEMMEGELRQKVAPGAFRLHQNMGCFVGMAVLAVIAAVGTFFYLATAIWVTCVLPLAALFLAGPFFVSRNSSYRRAEQIWQDVQRQYPSFVAEFCSDPKA